MYKELADKEWLRKRYIDDLKTMQQIADEIGCNKTSVSRALIRHGVGRRRHTSRFEKLNDKEWLRKAYVDDERSTYDIAREAGTTPGNIVSHLETLGIQRRTSSEGLALAFPDGRAMEKHPNWKGGRRVSRGTGYVWLYVPEHPKATGYGYVQEHRLVAEEMLGRWLESSEVVHHIDGDKTNNDPSNLEVMTRGAHFRAHFEAVGKLHKANQRIAELEAENERLRGELERRKLDN
jgi:hypothetical protein